MGNKSLIIYSTDLKAVNMLPFNKAGRLFHAIANYHLTGTEPDFSSDLSLKILFNQIKDHIDMNEEKYEEIRQAKIRAAKTRWQKEKAKQEPPDTLSQADEIICNPMHMHTENSCGCYNDNVNVNDNVNDNVNVNVNVNDNDNVCVNNDTQISAHTQTKKGAYGTYNNVFLSKEEYRELTRRYPVNLNEVINSMSAYLKITGKAYADCYVKLLGWRLYDDSSQAMRPPSPQKPQPSYDLELFRKKALELKYVKKQ